MSQEGYADPITNNGPGFHSITPVSKLTERVFEPERLGQATKLKPPRGSGTKHCTCSEMHHNTLCCITKRRLPHLT